MVTITQRQKRIGLSLPLEVSGQSSSGARFTKATRSLNVSGGGICFESDLNMLVGSRLNLNIEVPWGLRKHFGGRSTYRADAIVCRVEPIQGGVAWRVGARFLRHVE